MFRSVFLELIRAWLSVSVLVFELAGRVVFRMPDWLHHILSAGRILLKSTFEAYMDQYMQLKLEQILQEHRVVSLITQLRGRTPPAPMKSFLISGLSIAAFKMISKVFGLFMTPKEASVCGKVFSCFLNVTQKKASRLNLSIILSSCITTIAVPWSELVGVKLIELRIWVNSEWTGKKRESEYFINVQIIKMQIWILLAI